MIRFGLCCLFYQEKIKFKTTTATFLLKKDISFRKNYLSEIILHNLESLKKALLFCSDHKIGCFRITSRFLPLFTYPGLEYKIEDLPNADKIFLLFREVKSFAETADIRLTLHPDQFVVLNSKDPAVAAKSLLELEYHGY